MIKANSSIAVVGSGISGLSAAWLLSKKYNVTLYETNDYLGGHARTLEYNIKKKNNLINYDAGFIVYNEKNYPNFTKLLNYFNVQTINSNMSFSVSYNEDNFEYGTRSILSLSNGTKNIFSKKIWHILYDLKKFYRESRTILNSNTSDHLNVEEFLNKQKYSKVFIFCHLMPMASAIWSMPINEIFTMPIKSLLLFLNNHGLLQFKDRPQWRTIYNGSKSYIKKIEESTNAKILKNEVALSITRKDKKVTVKSSNYTKNYDNVVLAIHSDKIINILKTPTNNEKLLLNKARYQSNDIYIHNDRKLMPKNEKVWSSWNIKFPSIEFNNDYRKQKPLVTYWMNLLQNIDKKYPIFVSLNPKNQNFPNEKNHIKNFKFRHPVMDFANLSLKNSIENIQGKDRIWYCGAWLGYGFHEDGLTSGIKIATKFGVKPPW